MLVEVKRTCKRIVKLKVENGVLYVLANIFVSKRRIRAIIEQNIEWVRKQSTVQSQVCEKSKPVVDAAQHSSECVERSDSVVGAICTGRKTLIFGEVVTVMPSASSRTRYEGDTLYINEKLFESKDSRIKAVAAYIKKVAQEHVSVEVARFGTEKSLCPAKIEFKDVADGWLRCALAAEKIFCIDYRIAQLPAELRKYLIAHAFAHLRSSGHGDKFWNTMSEWLPDYKLLGDDLLSYDFLKEI